jgi:glutamate N-acetyltransferase / amino-acid N-acetyltransferase
VFAHQFSIHGVHFMTLPAVPRGFRVAGVHCGIKKDSAKEDLSLFVADHDVVAAGVYTQNLVFAAPVAINRERTPSNQIRAVVVNSGNANACTGERGHHDAREMCRIAAELSSARADQALVMSTGVIGVFLDLPKIQNGISAAATRLARDEPALLSAARGILTTDNGPKIAGRTLNLHSRTVQLTGVCKGAAMIGPRMATMLCLIMTDAALPANSAQQALLKSVQDSFNCVSVEGHMSTNDTVLLLASGDAGGEPLKGSELAQFQAALDELCVELARMIPNDGEGATHLITVDIQGAASRDAAYRIAKTVAESSLVKTAITGADPNWGRIVSAAGYAGVPFDPRAVQLTVNGFVLFRDGSPVPFDAKKVSAAIREQRETHLELRFQEGTSQLRFWTSDLTVDYVRFNSEYTT